MSHIAKDTRDEGARYSSIPLHGMWAVPIPSVNLRARQAYHMLMKREDLWLVASVLLLSAGCTNATTAPRTNVAPVTGLRAVEVVSGLSSPVHLTAPAGDGRLFVVEQAGRIRIVESGALRAQPFLDISGQISAGGEIASCSPTMTSVGTCRFGSIDVTSGRTAIPR